MASSKLMIRRGGVWEPWYKIMQYRGGSWVPAKLWQYQGGQWVKIVNPTSTTAFTTTWNSTGAQIYASNASPSYSQRGDQDGKMYQGYSSSSWGENVTMFFFNSASIRSTLSGATITAVTVTFGNVSHTYYGAGATIRVGTHNANPTPSSYSSVATNLASKNVTEGDNPSLTLPDSVGNQFRDNTVKGIVLDANSTNVTYYLYGTGTCSLKIDYTKDV